MPEEIDLEKKLNEEREKVRLNSIKMLKLLGYEHDATKFTQEQLDARIELQVDINNKRAKDATSSTTPVIKLFNGVDGERENRDAVENAKPTALEFEDIVGGYDALTAQIPQLRENAHVGHYEGLAERENIRILRLPASIRLDPNHSIIRRVLL